MQSRLVERVFAVVFFTTVGLMAFGAVMAAAGIDSPLFELLAIVMVVGFVLLFGGGLLLALLFPFREGMLVLIRGEGSRLDRFAKWTAQNMEIEDQSLSPEGATPTRSEKIGGVVIFVVYFGFVWALVGFVAWRIATHLI